MTHNAIDVLTIGRSSADLYGRQVGGKLENMRSFSKYVGGSPANIAIGCARLGLRPALLTRVGDEHMGRFIREELEKEGVNTNYVITDPERLTALVLLGIRDDKQFPLLFYRERCADMALCEEDIDEEMIKRSRIVCATGTHLSHSKTRAAVIKALHLARKHEVLTALDIDYRPNLWGLGGHGSGEERYVSSQGVSATLQETLNLFDLIVGTEEEMAIAGAHDDALRAIVEIRRLSNAVLVCKRGPLGAVVFEGDIHEGSLDEGKMGSSFSVEVYNVLGAGDGFMAGLLWGWRNELPWTECLTYANACGALAVSRHGCAPSYPSLEELHHFVNKGSSHYAVRHDPTMTHLHRVTTRTQTWPRLTVFAFDHRKQFTDLADRLGQPHARIADFKNLCLEAALRTARSDKTNCQSFGMSYGILCDDQWGRQALHASSDYPLWIGRPVEEPASRPLRLEVPTPSLAEWPSHHVVKVLCFAHPDDDEVLLADQLETLMRLYDSCQEEKLDLLVEIIASKHGARDTMTSARVMQAIYQRGIKPDWWKCEPEDDPQAWQNIGRIIDREDPWCRGIILLGLEKPEAFLLESFQVAAHCEHVKGFAIGRSIFNEAADQWFQNKISDKEAIDTMQSRFTRLASAWNQVQSSPTP